MVEIVLNSGTTWVVPDDWDNNNNSVVCFGAGAGGSGVASALKSTNGFPGGGAGARSIGVNIALTPGATVPIRIGAAGVGGVGGDSGDDGGDTCFNSTSLANAASNGTSVSVAAEGGTGGDYPSSVGNGGGLGGQASNSVGNSTKTNGGNGGNRAAGDSGAGGDCPGGGTGGAPVSAVGNGQPGNVPGGGGSGCKGAGTRNGGDGGNGRIVINYTPKPPDQHRMFMVFSQAWAAIVSGWTALSDLTGAVFARPRRVADT